MADPTKRLKDRELLLLVTDAAGGTLDGRTVAQKLLYFSGVALEQPTGHTPYFYGPYSDEFDAALSRAVLANELSEHVERIPDWRGGPDALKHIYSLSDRGAEEVSHIRSERPDEAKIVAHTVKQIEAAVPAFRQKSLSAAAKIHLIVSEQDDALTMDQLRSLAGELGWSLSQPEIEHAVEVLSGLNLIEVHA